MMTATPTQDASAKHWIYRLPKRWQPYAQLSRLDRPVGYWLLALPGWMGLAFAGLTLGYEVYDLIWAALILIGAVAMRGAGCTYNDIVDQDLDAQVARTALRPLPAGSVTTRQARTWLFIQVGIGFCVWLCLPLIAKLVALGSIPLVAAYPFMKRITWWPQIWLGLTFNWAFLVAYSIKTEIDSPALIFFLGLIFWTIGYDTIYACQDVEDDAIIGVKSTARRFGKWVKPAVAICYSLFILFILIAMYFAPFWNDQIFMALFLYRDQLILLYPLSIILTVMPAAILSALIVWRFDSTNTESCLSLFKKNIWVAVFLIVGIALWSPLMALTINYTIH